MGLGSNPVGGVFPRLGFNTGPSAWSVTCTSRNFQLGDFGAVWGWLGSKPVWGGFRAPPCPKKGLARLGGVLGHKRRGSGFGAEIGENHQKIPQKLYYVVGGV